MTSARQPESSMLLACYDFSMSAIQIKDVSEEIHDQLRERAKESNCTLGEYVLRLIRADLLRPSVAKWKSDMLGKPGAAIDSQFVIDEIRRMRDTAK